MFQFISGGGSSLTLGEMVQAEHDIIQEVRLGKNDDFLAYVIKHIFIAMARRTN